MVRALWDVGTEQEGQGGGERKGSLPGNHLHNAACAAHHALTRGSTAGLGWRAGWRGWWPGVVLMVLLGLPPQFVEPRPVLPGSSHGGSEEQEVTGTARVHLQPLLGSFADCYRPLSRAGTRQSQEQEETPGWAGLGEGEESG